MKTTIDIPEKLLAETIRHTGAKNAPASGTSA